MPNGDSVFLNEAKSAAPDNLPLKMLPRILRLLQEQDALGQLPEDFGFSPQALFDWINLNPQPQGKGEAAAYQWMVMVSQRAICMGLTLAWRGTITTSIQDRAALVNLIRTSREFSQLEWPRSEHIIISTLHTKEDARHEKLILGELIGG